MNQNVTVDLNVNRKIPNKHENFRKKFNVTLDKLTLNSSID